MQPTNTTKIQEWYLEKYPDDTLGQKINASATFAGLFYTLDRQKSVYTYLGVTDSIVRERVNSGLSAATGTEYEEIYNQWLAGLA